MRLKFVDWRKYSIKGDSFTVFSVNCNKDLGILTLVLLDYECSLFYGRRYK